MASASRPPVVPVQQLNNLWPGMHISIERPWTYHHHAIIIANEGNTAQHVKIVQFDGEPNPTGTDTLLTQKANASVVVADLQRFLRQGGADAAPDYADVTKIRIVQYLGDSDTARAATVKRAMLFAQHLPLTGWYDAVACNCEHFATFCRTDHWYSAQAHSTIRYFLLTSKTHGNVLPSPAQMKGLPLAALAGHFHVSWK